MSRYSSRSYSSTLYVRNISDRVRYEDLRHLFQKYGKLIDVTIPLDYYTRMPKGYCFVEYEDSRDAEDALRRLDRQRLFGREIEVEFARGDRKTPGEMRGRDRDRDSRRYGGRSDRGYDDYEDSSRHRSRSRSGGGSRRRRGGSSRGGRNQSYSKSRSRSFTKDRSGSPREQNGGGSRGTRDRSRSRSLSRQKSPHQRRSPKPSDINHSRSASPTD